MCVCAYRGICPRSLVITSHTAEGRHWRQLVLKGLHAIKDQDVRFFRSSCALLGRPSTGRGVCLTGMISYGNPRPG